jgi:hypothetical protein
LIRHDFSAIPLLRQTKIALHSLVSNEFNDALGEGNLYANRNPFEIQLIVRMSWGFSPPVGRKLVEGWEIFRLFDRRES